MAGKKKGKAETGVSIKFDNASTAALCKQVKNWRDRGEGLIQRAAVSCILNAVKHGDANMAMLLIKNMGGDNGGKTIVRTNAVKYYFVKSGCMTWNAEKKNFGIDKAKRAGMLEALNANPQKLIDSLMSIKLVEANKETEFEAFDFPKLMNALIQRAKKAKDKLVPEGSKVQSDFTGLEEAEAVYAQLYAKKVVEAAKPKQH